ncbi:MAG: heparinase II/III family protein [Caulobacterales bacterium]
MARSPAPLPGPILLPLALLVGARRQMGREWRAGPAHALAIAGPKPKSLAAKPRDVRPADAAAGERLLRGEFRFHGEALEVGAGGNPWDRPCPSERFATDLHGFAWAGDLIAAGEAGARETLRLWLEWRRLFGRARGFAWMGEALERRVFNLACAAPALLPVASDAEGAALIADLARQARHLISETADPGRALERAAAAALAGAALADPAGAGLLKRALPRLERETPIAVLPDGVHASRAPERGLALLFDLLALDDALSQRGQPAPVEVARAIDRLSAATRFFAMADGRLAAFQGGEAGSAQAVATVLALDASRTATVTAAIHGGYRRMESRQIQVIADVAAPADGAWSAGACDQPAAIEIVCGGRRLVTACAWSASAPAAAARLRGPIGGSCLALGAQSGGAALEGLAAGAFGPRLKGGAGEVKAERHEDDTGVWLDIAHDAWRRAFGLSHTRRLFLDLAAEELRGEDQTTPIGRGGRRGLIPYAVRFHLLPQVSAQVAVDGKSVLIKPAGEPGWRLRSNAAELRLDPGVVFEDGETRQTETIVLAGFLRPSEGGHVRWKLSRAEA